MDSTPSLRVLWHTIGNRSTTHVAAGRIWVVWPTGWVGTHHTKHTQDRRWSSGELQSKSCRGDVLLEISRGTV